MINYYVYYIRQKTHLHHQLNTTESSLFFNFSENSLDYCEASENGSEKTSPILGIISIKFCFNITSV